MPINFGGYPFTSPVPLMSWKPPALAGVYVILKPDAASNPQPYRELYFGITEDFAERGFPLSHHKSDAWCREAGTQDKLFVAIHAMPNSTPEMRRAVESELIEKYRPVCNSRVPQRPLQSFNLLNKR